MAAALPYFVIAASAASVAASAASVFKGPPKAPASTVDPLKRSQADLEAAYAQSQFLKKRSGYASTILTGPQGIAASAGMNRQTLGA